MRARWGALVAVALLAAACDSGGDGRPPGFGLLTPGSGGVPHQAAAGLPRDVGTVDLVSGATTVDVRTAELGAQRVRAVTPDGARVAPVLDVAGDTVRVHLVETGQAGPAAVTVLLDPRVRWQVRMSGGAVSQRLDLRGARLSGVDLVAGATRIEVGLPVPDRTVPVRMAGGASEFTVHVPAGVATGVRVGGGAASTDVDGVRRTGLAGGTVLTTATATDRYDVDATAGVSTLVLDRI
ncbi:MAG TPA: hypothetical protein VI357_14965 [Mycobacteriales bacterium]